MDKYDFMKVALFQAEKSLKYGDVPVGAVIVKDGKIIAKAYNKRNKSGKAIAHAELIAITKANRKQKDFRLCDCDIYVTKEPCLMCMGGLLSARIRKIYFGAKDNKYSAIHLATDNNFNHKCEIEGGILEEECRNLLTKFFKNLRGENENITTRKKRNAKDKH